MSARSLFAVVALLALTWPHSSAAPAPRPQLRLQVLGPVGPVGLGDDITLQVVLSAEGDGRQEFLLGSFPQVFGIYLLGPWGPIQPDPAKVRPENWMHQEHSAAARIVVTRRSPYRHTVRLSDYFRVQDVAVFRPGVYQVNVKFYDVGLRLPAPIDSGAVRFELTPRKGRP